MKSKSLSVPDRYDPERLAADPARLKRNQRSAAPYTSTQSTKLSPHNLEFRVRMMKNQLTKKKHKTHNKILEIFVGNDWKLGRKKMGEEQRNSK